MIGVAGEEVVVGPEVAVHLGSIKFGEWDGRRAWRRVRFDLRVVRRARGLAAQTEYALALGLDGLLLDARRGPSRRRITRGDATDGEVLKGAGVWREGMVGVAERGQFRYGIVDGGTQDDLWVMICILGT